MAPGARRFSARLLLLVLLALPGVADATPWGWLGVRIRDLSEQEMEEISLRHGIREGYGALVVEVLKETPAAQAGLKNGDLVVTFKDGPVVDTRALQRVVAATPVGEEVALTVLRAGEGRRRVQVRLGVMPAEVVAERVAAEFGFVMREPTPEREGQSSPPRSLPTVAVVMRGSQAERAGLRTGDVIVEVNGRSVASRKEVGEALLAVALDRPLRLTVAREGEARALTLSPPESGIP